MQLSPKVWAAEAPGKLLHLWCQARAPGCGVTHHRDHGGDRIPAPVPASARTHGSVEEGVVGCVLHEVCGVGSCQVPAPGAGSPPSHQEDKQPLGDSGHSPGRPPVLGRSRAHSPRAWAQQGTGHPLSKWSQRTPLTSPQARSARLGLSPVPKLFAKLHLWAQRRRQLTRLSYHHQPLTRSSEPGCWDAGSSCPCCVTLD